MIPTVAITHKIRNFKNKISDRMSSENYDLNGVFSKSLANSQKGIIDNKESSFVDMLEDIAPAHKPNTKDINMLWKDLPQLERELIQTRSQDALENYKNQVHALLNTILSKNTLYKKLTTPVPGSIQKKEYTYIEYLDEKLKILAEIISHPQNSAFQILKQMDNIKGFLIDIQG